MKYKLSSHSINYNVFLFLFISLVLLSHSHAWGMNFNAIEHGFSIKLNETRAIYPLSSVKGISLSVKNPQDYPILVQTQVKGDDKKSPAPFVVTPPLFRLDSGMQGRVRVIRTGGNFPQDRESLQWLCLTGVPPKEGDMWDNSQHDKNKVVQKDVNLDIRLSINTCIKLLVRPDQLKKKPEEVAGELVWHRNGNQLKVINPTPFYMNFKAVNLGGKDINSSDSRNGNYYVTPFAEKNFSLPVEMVGVPSEVSWTIINDYGQVSKTFKANI
ncbi:molecular chaperone [Yersinia enterocolitica]|nr:molecular chaperone [Yersinia enterocolitica]EKN6378206.1 molecular chaperone [Yersinia enterocolitica]